MCHELINLSPKTIIVIDTCMIATPLGIKFYLFICLLFYFVVFQVVANMHFCILLWKTLFDFDFDFFLEF